MSSNFKHTKRLEQVGFSREQAEAQVQIVTEIIEDDLATKQDLQIMQTTMRSEMQQVAIQLRAEMQQLATQLRAEMQQLATQLHAEMQQLATLFESKLFQLQTKMESKHEQLETRLTIKLGAFMLIGFTTMLTVMKFWNIH